MSKRPLRVEETALRQLSESGRNFVIQSTDPFHDYPFGTPQIPDGKLQSSFVKKYNRQLVLKCPFDLGANQTWNVNFFTSPYLQGAGQVYDYSNDVGSLAPFPVTKNIELSPVMYVATLIENGKVADVKFGTLALNDPTLSDNTVYTRVVGLGFEVHDVTAELYKQGACTVWKTTNPNTYDPVPYGAYDAQGFHKQFLLHSMNCGEIPATAADVVSIQNSHTWESKEGAYVVADIRGYDIQSVSDSSGLIYVGDNQQSDLPRNTCFVIGATNYFLETSSIVSFTPSRAASINPSGALFSGLGPNSTLRLDLRCGVEMAPGLGSSSNSLATGCPEADPAAIALVLRSRSLLPAGVRVAENSFGDWFRRIARLAADIVPTILGFIPQTRMIAPAIGQIATIVKDKIITKPAPPKPKIPLPPVPKKK